MRNRKPKSKKPNLTQTTFTRFMLIVALMVVWLGVISVRLVHLQVNQHQWLRGRAEDQRQDVKRSKLLRGTIFDRNGRALAMSVKVKTLYADPLEIDDVPATAAAVAKALRVNQKQILAPLKKAKDDGKRFVPLAKKLDEDTVQRINRELETAGVKKADLPKYAGLHWKEDQVRSYPYKSLAAHVLGFSNSEDKGQAGIEQSQEDVLHGAIIKKLQERDRLGRIYDETVFEREPPKDVVLTISNSIQYKTELALEAGVKAAGAKSGTAVVMDPKTGEILALANYPTFDPNLIRGADADHISNKAIQSVYSPGSVFKLITYGAALDKKLIRPDEPLVTGSSIEVGGRVFKEGHPIANATYSKALAVSSNVGAIKTALKVGKADFADFIKKFGFGSRTGIELPAETAGITRPVERWNGDSLASMSIGYEIGVTALQMTSAFATIANDGVRVQPHIIKEIRQSDEEIVSSAQPEKIQVVSPEAARDLRSMLREVVVSGTGKRAQLNGYTSAGKTGTAWKFNPVTKRVDGSKYISSFIGYAPADDPRLVIAVVMDEPTAGSRNGGQVSAPVFTEIAAQVLPELNVVPDATINHDALIAEEIPEEEAGNGVNPTGAPELNIAAAEKKQEPAKSAPKPAPANAPRSKSAEVRPEKKPAASPPRAKPAPAADRKSAAADPKGAVKNRSSTDTAKRKT